MSWFDANNANGISHVYRFKFLCLLEGNDLFQGSKDPTEMKNKTFMEQYFSKFNIAAIISFVFKKCKFLMVT